MARKQKVVMLGGVGAAALSNKADKDNGVHTGVSSFQTISPDIADLGTVSSGTVTLSSTKSVNKVTLSGSAATIALPASPPDGWRSLVASITGNVALTVTTPSLYRLDDPALGTVTSVSIAAATAGKAIFSFLAIGGSYVGFAVIGDDSSIPSSKLAGLSTDGTNASPSNSTFLSSQAYATHLAAALDAFTLPYTDVTGITQSAFLTRGTTGTGAAELGTFGAGLSFNTSTRVLSATNTGSSTPVEISGTDIDWTDGGVFTDTISAHTTYTFSGTTDGQTIRVLITATGAYNVTWPANVYGAPSQTSTATDLYQITRFGVFYVCSRLSSNLTIDTAAPVVTDVNINTDGDELTVTFDKDVTVTDGSGFTLTMTGGGVTVSSSPTGTGTSALVFALTGRTVAAGETGTLDYNGDGGIVGEANGVAVEDFTGETVDNASTYSTYTFTEDFTTGSGTPSGWTVTLGTPNFQYTPALIGSYSLGVPSGASTYRDLGSDKDEQWFFLRADIDNPVSSAAPIEIRNSAGSTLASIEIRSDRIQAYQGSAGGSYLVTAPTAESCYWIRYKKSTGSNDGILTIYFERNGTTETRGSAVLSITTGTSTGAARRLQLRCPASGTNVYDKIRASDNSIGSSPL